LRWLSVVGVNVAATAVVIAVVAAAVLALPSFASAAPAMVCLAPTAAFSAFASCLLPPVRRLSTFNRSSPEASWSSALGAASACGPARVRPPAAVYCRARRRRAGCTTGLGATTTSVQQRTVLGGATEDTAPRSRHHVQNWFTVLCVSELALHTQRLQCHSGDGEPILRMVRLRMIERRNTSSGR
jgi:hypothetical protein